MGAVLPCPRVVTKRRDSHIRRVRQPRLQAQLYHVTSSPRSSASSSVKWSWCPLASFPHRQIKKMGKSSETTQGGPPTRSLPAPVTKAGILMSNIPWDVPVSWLAGCWAFPSSLGWNPSLFEHPTHWPSHLLLGGPDPGRKQPQTPSPDGCLPQWASQPSFSDSDSFLI